MAFRRGSFGLFLMSVVLLSTVTEVAEARPFFHRAPILRAVGAAVRFPFRVAAGAVRFGFRTTRALLTPHRRFAAPVAVNVNVARAPVQRGLPGVPDAGAVNANLDVDGGQGVADPADVNALIDDVQLPGSIACGSNSNIRVLAQPNQGTAQVFDRGNLVRNFTRCGFVSGVTSSFSCDADVDSLVIFGDRLDRANVDVRGRFLGNLICQSRL